MDKKCEDCRHHERASRGLCLSPNTQGLYAIAESATQQRTWGRFMSWLLGTCGSRGRFFEVKPVRLVPPLPRQDRPGLTAKAAAEHHRCASPEVQHQVSEAAKACRFTFESGWNAPRDEAGG